MQNGLLVVHQTKSGKVRRVPVPPGMLEGRIGRIAPFNSHGTFNRRVQELSGVERFHVHQLRHSFACRWLEAGGSLAALQEILGHSTIVTTQRYARLGEAHVQDEARRVFGNLVTKVVTEVHRRKSTSA
jgi:integrase